MNPFHQKVAVVTGAGSGIGRALALALARRGARLALADIDQRGLDETGTLGQAAGAQVHLQALNVADADAFCRYAETVVGHFGAVHQIYNNAGIGFNRSILASSFAEYERVIAVNLWGVIHGTKSFLPHLIASGDGHVINVSSLNGMMAYPGISHYCTSKFAVRGFTEALHIEMLTAGYPVAVSAVYPGGIRTNIVANAQAFAKAQGSPVNEESSRRYSEKLLTLSPDIAAGTILDGVAKRKPRILVGRDAWWMDKFVRAFPSLYPRGIVHFSRRVASSDKATKTLKGKAL